MRTEQIYLWFHLEGGRHVRGYSLPHLLAVEAARHGDKEQLKLYFSTELIVVTGAGLERITQELIRGSLSKQTEGPCPVEKIERRLYSVPPHL